MNKLFAAALTLAILLAGCGKQQQQTQPNEPAVSDTSVRVEAAEESESEKKEAEDSTPPETAEKAPEEALPDADRILSDFHEAQEMWSWFRMSTMPLDMEHPAAEEGYYPVNYPGVTTMNELRELLFTRFSDELAVALLAPVDGFQHYKDIDGVLCAIDADRGADITVGAVDYVADIEGHKVLAVIHRQDFNEATGALELTGETESVEFPFEWTAGGARFTSFVDIF